MQVEEQRAQPPRNVTGTRPGSRPPMAIGNPRTGEMFYTYANKYYRGSFPNGTVISEANYNAGLARGKEAPEPSPRVSGRRPLQRYRGERSLLGHQMPVLEEAPLAPGPSKNMEPLEPARYMNGKDPKSRPPTRFRNPRTGELFYEHAGEYFRGSWPSTNRITKAAFNAETAPEPEEEEERLAVPRSYNLKRGGSRRSTRRRGSRRSSARSTRRH